MLVNEWKLKECFNEKVEQIKSTYMAKIYIFSKT